MRGQLQEIVSRFKSRRVLALLALAVFSDVFMILNIQYPLAYIGLRAATFGFLADMTHRMHLKRLEQSQKKPPGNRATS